MVYWFLLLFNGDVKLFIDPVTASYLIQCFSSVVSLYNCCLVLPCLTLNFSVAGDNALVNNV